MKLPLPLTPAPLLLALAGPLGAQEVHVVDSTGAGEFLTVQEAVDAASDDDTVLVRSGDYRSEAAALGITLRYRF